MSLLSKFKANKNISEFILSEENQVDKGFISTGCMSLNILFSGRLDGGIPIGKISQVAAPSALGKSFIGMKVAKNAQKKGLEVVYIDTEFAFDFGFAESIGLDNDKLMVIQDNQIESVQKTIMQMLEGIDKKERDRLLILIDSWGGLVTSKTTTDALDGKDVSDMTVSKKKNMLSRLLMGGPTVFVINQVYDTFDQYNPLAIAGGRGLYFASSSIVLGSSKAREKDSDGDISGAIVTAVTKKSRSSKENTKLKYLIRYDGGIHPVYGILEDAMECGVVEKPSMGWYTRPDVENDRKWREKEVWNTWEVFWAPILKSAKFKKFIEDKYSFKESKIIDENFDFDDSSTDREE
jgi:RecA/RadA recombinase